MKLLLEKIIITDETTHEEIGFTYRAVVFKEDDEIKGCLSVFWIAENKDLDALVDFACEQNPIDEAMGFNHYGKRVFDDGGELSPGEVAKMMILGQYDYQARENVATGVDTHLHNLVGG